MPGNGRVLGEEWKHIPSSCSVLTYLIVPLNQKYKRNLHIASLIHLTCTISQIISFICTCWHTKTFSITQRALPLDLFCGFLQLINNMWLTDRPRTNRGAVKYFMSYNKTIQCLFEMTCLLLEEMKLTFNSRCTYRM